MYIIYNPSFQQVSNVLISTESDNRRLACQPAWDQQRSSGERRMAGLDSTEVFKFQNCAEANKSSSLKPERGTKYQAPRPGTKFEN